MDVMYAGPEMVDHDGRVYLLIDLIHYLPGVFACDVADMVPRTPQAFWDEVVHRWPHAAEQAAEAVDRDWDW